MQDFFHNIFPIWIDCAHLRQILIPHLKKSNAAKDVFSAIRLPVFKEIGISLKKFTISLDFITTFAATYKNCINGGIMRNY